MPGSALEKEKDYTSGIAELVLISFRIITCDGIMWLYKEETGLWMKDAKERIRVYVRTALDNNISIHNLNEVIDKIKTSTLEGPDIFESEYLIATKNKVIDLKTDGIHDFHPDFHLITSIGAAYDPKAPCFNFLKFLKELGFTQEQIETTFEIIGYCLWKEYNIKSLFFWVGSGNNGKSILLSIISAFLGKQNVSSVSLHRLINPNENFASANLFNKMANFAGDIPSTLIKDTSIIKTLTGGDYLRADEKYKKPFDFMNRAKMIFAMNELPKVWDDTSAWYNRVIILEFTKSFTEDSNIRTKILNECTSEQELSGILNLALTGLKQLQDRGHFIDSGSLEEKRTEYLIKSDSITAFLEYGCIFEIDYRTEKRTFYGDYEEWCKENKVRPRKYNPFCKIIKRNEGIDQQKASDGTRWYHGVRAGKPTQQELPEDYEEK
jgi:putative DNA primase/helicase